MGFPDVPFASVSDLENRWRPLTPGESAQADVLLEDASLLIVSQCPRAAKADPAVLRMVVCSVVKRAMQSPPIIGAESFQQTAGPYQGTVNFVNPTGDLYLSKSEKRSLGCGRQTAFTVSLGGPDV